MKISKVIFTLAVILLILCAVAFVFPKEGISIGRTLLKFPSLEDIFSDNTPQYADIDNIVEEIEEEKEEESKIKRVNIKDSTVVNIEFPENDPTYFDNFFQSLNNIGKNGNKIRVIHYGDSQIEGDRITSYIRSRLQGVFGGKGQGEIPLHSLSHINNTEFSYSDSCLFYSIIDNKKTSFYNYGLMQSAVVTNSDSNHITIKFAKPITEDLTLYCKAITTDAKIVVSSGADILKTCNFNDINSLTSFEILNNRSLKTLNIQIIGRVELYSLDLSKGKGIYVDNVSLRGSSGWGFTKNNGDFFSLMSEKLNVNLIILQFGVNAVPQDEQTIVESYSFHKAQLKKQITFLKKTNPNAAIVVIGVSDRSRKNGDNYETNPNVKKILQVQREVAKECDVAFWDLFKAMGGENSMPSWVLREKPLANPDFTHFNNRGAKYVGEMFFKALENAYFDYQQQ